MKSIRCFVQGGRRFALWVVLLLSCCLMACDKEDVVDQSELITYFAVVTDNDTVEADINHYNRRIVVEGLSNTNAIKQVVYTLAEGARITPAPESFVGKWKKSQSVTIRSESGKVKSYLITFPVFAPLNEDQNGGKEPSTPVGPSQFQTLMFEDDFNSLDTIPDPMKWELCERMTSDWNEEMSESYAQAYVKYGNLVLLADKEGDEYVAGGIQSRFSFTFGRVEVRAALTRLPNGAFPAIWMMPSRYIYPSWPNCGEIDIMEHVKQEAVIYQTVHTHYTYDLNIKNPSNGTTYMCSFGGFCVYAMEWTPDEITFFVDGVKTFSYPNLHLSGEADMKQWPFTKDAAFYVILNMGLGRNNGSSWAGPISDASLPATMLVDWVRIYQ